MVPSGRLPVGVPAHHGGQPSTYLGPPLAGESKGVSNLDPTPLFPFGHGLSYTEFAYTDLELSRDEIRPAGDLAASVTVRNTGDRDGDEVAQVARPVRQLVGFARVPLRAGEAARVTFRLHADRTSFTGVDLTRIVEPGSFTLAVGRSSTDLPLSASFRIVGATRVVAGERVMTTPVEVRPL